MCLILADLVEIAYTTVLYNGWNFQWLFVTLSLMAQTCTSDTYDHPFQTSNLLPHLSIHSQAEACTQCWLRLWKSQMPPSFIMVEPSGEFLSAFHQWRRPAPPILLISALQVGRFLPQLLVHSQTEACGQFWVHLWKSQTLPSFI